MDVDHASIIAFIGACTDPKKLKNLIANAEAKGVAIVADAAPRRLYRVQAGAQPGTLAFDVWQSIHALEDALSSEAGATRRLSRTRQKIQRVGEEQTVVDLVAGNAKASSGYEMLLARGWPELTFEALALKYNMAAPICDAARKRLEEGGIDTAALLAKSSDT